MVHQTFRLLFELTGGFGRKSRTSIDRIVQHARELGLTSVERREAMLIWEASFYDDSFPRAYREHNRGAWHYILAFWSVSFSGFLSLGVILADWIFGGVFKQLSWIVLIVSLVLILVFYAKGALTFRQEVAYEETVVDLHWAGLFSGIARRLVGERVDKMSSIVADQTSDD